MTDHRRAGAVVAALAFVLLALGPATGFVGVSSADLGARLVGSAPTRAVRWAARPHTRVVQSRTRSPRPDQLVAARPPALGIVSVATGLGLAWLALAHRSERRRLRVRGPPLSSP
jgi:hypothetical protein